MNECVMEALKELSVAELNAMAAECIGKAIECMMAGDVKGQLNWADTGRIVAFESMHVAAGAEKRFACFTDVRVENPVFVACTEEYAKWSVDKFAVLVSEGIVLVDADGEVSVNDKAFARKRRRFGRGVRKGRSVGGCVDLHTGTWHGPGVAVLADRAHVVMPVGT